MINLEDYQSTVSFVVSQIKNFPQHLIPKIIIRSGNLKSPGISDIDFLIGFEDSFLYGNEFIEEYNLLIKEIKHRDIFFLHLPNIYPISSLLDLPKYTFNEIDNIEIVFGENITINKSEIGVTAYQKKPEFGPASVKLNDSKITNTKKQILNEKKSKITFNNKIMVGTDKDVERIILDLDL